MAVRTARLNPGGSAPPGQAPKARNGPNRTPEVQTLPTRAGLYRELRNLANPHPLARLEALHEIGEALRQELDVALFIAELEQVRQARSRNPQPSWREIGAALGITGQYAQRKFQDALK